MTSVPEVGLGVTDSARDYRLGWRLRLARRGADALELGVEATRREEADGKAEPEHGIALRLTARW